MTQSAPLTAVPASGSTRSAMPSSLTRSSVRADLAWATISPARPSRRAARAIELPIRPMPSRARRWKMGSRMTGGLEGSQGFDQQIVLLRKADGDAQAVRQAVAADAAHDQAVRAQMRVGSFGGRGIAEIGEHEVCLAWVDADSRFSQRGGDPRAFGAV